MEIEEIVWDESELEEFVEPSDTIDDSEEEISETPSSDDEEETQETTKKRRKKLIKYITEGLSVWTIILICLGAALGLGIITVFIIFYIKKRKKI